MPSNSQATIAIWKDASAVAAFALSVQDTGARLRAIPATGTTVDLPQAQPTDGDAYEVLDADGSCSSGNLITIVPPAGTTIRGGANLILAAVFASARLTFDASQDDWSVDLGAGGSNTGLSAPWHDVAAGTVFQSGSGTLWLSCDSTAAQTTIKLDPAPLDGQIQVVRLTGTTQVTPVLVLVQGAGNTVEDAITAGVFDAVGTFLAIQCEIAAWKYDKAAKEWKLYDHVVGAATAALKAAAWAVDYVAGLNSNSGAPGSPLATAAELRRRWNGGVSGVRPLLPPNAITVTITGSAPVASKFADPECVLWDLDVSPDTYLLIEHTTTIKRSSHLTASTARAQTATGQQTITDGAVNFTPDLDQLFLDTTASAVAWVTVGGTPAKLSAAYAAQNPTTVDPFAGLAAAAVISPDNYEILALPQVYFGRASQCRMGGGGAGQAHVVIYRGHGLAGDDTDVLQIEGDADNPGNNGLTGVSVTFLECIVEQSTTTEEGGVFFMNCAQPKAFPRFTNMVCPGGLTGGYLAGYARCPLSCGAGTQIDQDFYLIGAVAYGVFGFKAANSGFSLLGACARFLNGAAGTNAILIDAGASMKFGANYGAVVFYGETSGSEIALVKNGSRLLSTSTAAAGFVFDGGAAAFFHVGHGLANAYGIDDTAAQPYVGPTSITVAHLDAARAAGTGFGSLAVDPTSGSLIAVNGNF